MNQRKFRVWCEDHNEYEKHDCLLDRLGNIYHLSRGQIRQIRPQQHIVEFATNHNDKNKEEIYEGDKIKGTVHGSDCTEEKRPDLWAEYIVRLGRGLVDASDYEQYEVEILGFYLERIEPSSWEAPSILQLNIIEIIGTVHDKPEGKH